MARIIVTITQEGEEILSIGYLSERERRIVELVKDILGGIEITYQEEEDSPQIHPPVRFYRYFSRTNKNSSGRS